MVEDQQWGQDEDVFAIIHGFSCDTLLIQLACVRVVRDLLLN